jgi:hypothetical protein
MKNEALAGAATNLWSTLEEMYRIYRHLEDEEDGERWGLGRGYLVIEEKFSHVFECVEDLAIRVEEAAKRHTRLANLGPPGNRSERKKRE